MPSQRALHAHVGRLVLAVLRRGGQLLRAGGGAVAVLHDHQDAVVLVEHGVGDAGGQAVVPEAAVAHHRHRALGEHRVHRRVGGEAQAIAEHGVADVERRQRGEEVAADVGREVELAALLLQHLHRREHRPLRAADAESRRTRRQAARAARRLSSSATRSAGRARRGREISRRRSAPLRRCTRRPAAARPCRCTFTPFAPARRSVASTASSM